MFRGRLVPVERIELPTFGLQNRCSTAELNRKIEGAIGLYFIAITRRNRHKVAASAAVKYQSCRARATIGSAAIRFRRRIALRPARPPDHTPDRSPPDRLPETGGIWLAPNGG
jgi:hypothetical protein